MKRLTSVAVALVIGGPATGAGCVLCDDFEDGRLDALWSVLESDPAIITVQEQSGHLEFPAQFAGAKGGTAGVFGADWAIDANDDFALHIDWQVDLASLASGEAGIALAVAFAWDLEKAEVVDGIGINVGRDDRGPYIGFEEFRGGALVDDLFLFRRATTGAAHVWYDADEDILFLAESFGSPDAKQIAGLRAASGLDRVMVFAGAFTDDFASPLAAGLMWIDDFVIESGTIVDLSDSCPADLDASGDVGFTDLLAILATWGACDPDGSCPEDLDESGDVGFTDLLAALATWGACK